MRLSQINEKRGKVSFVFCVQWFFFQNKAPLKTPNFQKLVKITISKSLAKQRINLQQLSTM